MSLEAWQKEYVEMSNMERFLETQLLGVRRRRGELSELIAGAHKAEELLNHGTGSAYDVPELKLSYRERLLEGLDHILSRVTPSYLINRSYNEV